MVDVTEILVHWHAGRSQSEIAASLGWTARTVKKYLAPAGRGWASAGRAAQEPAGVGGAGAGLVPRAGRHAAAADHLGRRSASIATTSWRCLRRDEQADDLAAAA